MILSKEVRGVCRICDLLTVPAPQQSLRGEILEIWLGLVSVLRNPDTNARDKPASVVYKGAVGRQVALSGTQPQAQLSTITHRHLTMFARFPSFFLLAIYILPVLAVPGIVPRIDPPINQCNTGPIQCCNSVHDVRFTSHTSTERLLFFYSKITKRSTVFLAS